MIVQDAVINMIILTKLTSLLRKVLNLQKFSLAQLMENDDILYIGALLLRFSHVCSAHGCEGERRPTDCESPDRHFCKSTSCCSISWTVGIQTSLTSYSCVPNVKKCAIENIRIIMYSLQPIKKGEKIFETGMSVFYECPRELRPLSHKERFGYKCDCLACKDDWPLLFYNRDGEGEFSHVNPLKFVVEEVLHLPLESMHALSEAMTVNGNLKNEVFSQLKEF
ncbi:hypothetical protein QAD02_015052 [Eretmocerus hayati]|uniref:Uncharacterized protein n=1 Tax=Eretmocerus hayati TaxID=131215 RepID=A0ACC2P762_9HYME|nr:hypothetical protein QAD02_015052 [Eretmocerus hayati]